MTVTPMKCRKPSRCATCSGDMRRGSWIVYTPKDARPGQPRKWHHAECAS